MNDKIGLFITRDNLELSSSAIEIFENSTILDRRRAVEYDARVADYEQTKIREAFETQHTRCNTLEKVNLDMNPYGLLLQFNPNKRNNLKPTEMVTYSQIKETVKIVEEQLCSAGIKTDLENSSLVIYHNSFDVRTNREYSEYHRIYAKAMQQSIFKNGDIYFTKGTYYSRNKINEITVYNKTPEYKKETFEELGFECTRFEFRHKKIPKKKRYLIKDISEDVFLDLRQQDHSGVMKQMFSFDFQAYQNIFELINQCLKQGDKPNQIRNRAYEYARDKDAKELGLSLELALPNYPRSDPRYLHRKRLLEPAKIIVDSGVDSDVLAEAYYELKNKFKAVA